MGRATPMGRGVPSPTLARPAGAGAGIQVLPKPGVDSGASPPYKTTMPKISCVYAIQHRTTRKFLIGSTTSLRFRETMWKQAFRYNRVPKMVAQVSPDFDDWEFVVLLEV